MVSEEALMSSISYQYPIANVINFSIGSPAALLYLRKQLEQLYQNRQLVVIAAGNDGCDIGIPGCQTYPAVDTAEGSIRDATLVVGAHGPILETGHRSRPDFSNLESLTWIFSHRDAACLRPSGIRVNWPERPLRRHWLRSPRRWSMFFCRSRNLRPCGRGFGQARVGCQKRMPIALLSAVYWDIEAAVRVFDDIVRLKGGEIVAGRWREPANYTFCQSVDAEPPATVARIRVDAPKGGPVTLYPLWTRNGGIPVEGAGCVAADEMGPTLVLDDDNKTVRQFRWDEIETLVPAASLSRRRVQDPRARVTAAVPAPTVKEIQQALSDRGIPVAVDGKKGPQTKGAITDFQAMLHHETTGDLSRHKR